MNKKNKYLIPLIIVGLIFLVGGITVAKADLSFWDKVAQFTGKSIADKIGIPSFEDYDLGAVPSPDVYQRMYFHDGFIGDSTLHADLTWGTSSYGFATADDPTVNVKVMNNTGGDLLCNTVALDFSTALTSFGGSYAVGTTTATGDLSLTNTSTATLIASTAVVSTTADILNKEDESGTNDEEIWTWTELDYIVVSMAGAGGATSTDSSSVAGAFTGVAALHVNCWYRY